MRRYAGDREQLDERYTLDATDRQCRELARVPNWTLDVAACAESHLAAKYFTKASDGLRKRWNGRVWCNPPFSDCGNWVRKAWSEASRCEVVAMLLPAVRTDLGWWQAEVEPFRDGRPHGRPALLTTSFLPGRPRFRSPGGAVPGSPPFGCVLLLWRPR
jgi:hypothetical protein